MRPRKRGGSKQNVLVDTNLLILFTVGSYDPGLIEKHKRTQQFTTEDYRLLEDVLGSFRSVVTTPNVLTEVSNLVKQVGDPVAQKLQELLGSVIGKLEEQHVASNDCSSVAEFRRLGLADAAILRLAQDRGDLMVLTDDIHLYLALQKKGLKAVNFSHLREQAWQ